MCTYILLQKPIFASNAHTNSFNFEADNALEIEMLMIIKVDECWCPVLGALK